MEFVLSRSNHLAPASERERARGGAATRLQSGLYTSRRVSKELSFEQSCGRPLKIPRDVLARKNKARYSS